MSAAMQAYKAKQEERFEAIRVARDSLEGGTGIVVNWSPPLPDPSPFMRHDSGGWIYQMFRNGNKIMSGSSHDSLDATKARVLRYAADKGIIAPQVIVIQA